MRSAWLAVIAAAVAGCATGEKSQEEREFEGQMYLGDQMFKNSKFEDAVRAYRRAVQLQPNNYKATIGLGASCSEASLTLYVEAERLLGVRQHDAAMRNIERADDYVAMAKKCFARGLEMRPDDRVANYNIGLMYYKRATTPYNLPYPSQLEPPDEIKKDPTALAKWMETYEKRKVGVEHRRKERDEAIDQFKRVLSIEKTALEAPEHVTHCASPQAHRYLALALLTRGNWEGAENDTELARRHLCVYLAWILGCRQQLVEKAPNKSAEEKAQKEKDLEFFDRELLELKEILLGWRDGLAILERQCRLGTDDCPIPVEKRALRLDALARERLIIEATIRMYEEARKPKLPKKP